MTGRPSTFTQAKADAICALLIEGNSLRSICKRDDMPCTVTVLKWLNQYPDFASQYASAREAQADALVDDMIDIADDKTLDPNDRRVRIDTRKWLAGKMRPKKYSEKTLLGSDPDNPLPAGTASVDVAELAKQLRKQKLAPDAPQDDPKDLI